MTEKYYLSFLKSLSGSSDEISLTADYEKRLKEFSSAFQILDKAASYFYLFDFVRMQYLYVSESIKDIMGYTAKQWITAGPEWVFTTVFPEDIARLKNLHKALFKYYYSLPIANRKDYKYVWEVRVIRKDQKVIWIMQQGTFIDVDPDGKPILTFDILTDVTHFKKGNVMTLTMFKDPGTPTLKLYFPLQAKEPFTKREIELLKLMSDGLSSKEIADHLCISTHTVSTHRRNMLKKSGAKDSKKMIVYARDNGLI